MVKSLGFEYTEKMFGKDFKTPDELFEAVGKQVRTMPQIIISKYLLILITKSKSNHHPTNKKQTFF